VRTLLAVFQLFFSLVLLSGGGLLFQTLRYYQSLISIPEPEQVLLLSLQPSHHQYDDTRAREFYRQLLERVAGLPGVRSASLACGVDLADASFFTQRVEAGRVQPGSGTSQIDVACVAVAPGFLRTVGVTLGLLAALTLNRVWESLLYGVRPMDLTVLAAVSLLLVASALVASCPHVHARLASCFFRDPGILYLPRKRPKAADLPLLQRRTRNSNSKTCTGQRGSAVCVAFVGCRECSRERPSRPCWFSPAGSRRKRRQPAPRWPGRCRTPRGAFCRGQRPR